MQYLATQTALRILVVGPRSRLVREVRTGRARLDDMADRLITDLRDMDSDPRSVARVLHASAIWMPWHERPISDVLMRFVQDAVGEAVGGLD